MSGHQDGGPAFPREDYQADNAPGQRGMSLRDYFAAKAMQGMVIAEFAGAYSVEMWAKQAYEMADAMLRARAAIAKVDEKTA